MYVLVSDFLVVKKVLVTDQVMPGGPKEAYDLIAPIMMKCAAQAGEPQRALATSVPLVLETTSKRYNGIEYGDMQLISEAYDILKVYCARRSSTVRNINR
jgi:6-phosphogluconate dehydrogenase